MTTLENGERLGVPSPFLRLPTCAAIGAMIGVGLYGFVRAESRAGQAVWPSSPTTLEGMDPLATEATITFPGLGSLGGEMQSAHIREATGAPVSAYWHYSTDGFTIPGLVTQLRDKAPNLKRFDLHGHSMGGPVGLETARQAGLRLGSVVLQCSPFGPEDARNPRAAKLAARLKWDGGPRTKFAVATIQHKLRGESLPSAIQKAKIDAEGGCSPRLWTRQVRILQGMNLMSQTDAYAGQVDAKTNATYIRPLQADLDLTVNVEQAADRYATFFERLGVPFQVLEVDNMGHADTSLGCAALASCIRR